MRGVNVYGHIQAKIVDHVDRNGMNKTVIILHENTSLFYMSYLYLNIAPGLGKSC